MRIRCTVVRIGIAISNVAATSVTHTTIHLAHAALLRGHSVRFFEPWDFEVDAGGRLRGRAHLLDGPAPSREALVARLAARDTVRRSVEVDRLDVFLLRANPLDPALLSFALLVEAAGVPVLNPPAAILRTANKAWLATLADVPRPRTLVTRSFASLERFAAESVAGVVVKPARGCGGRGVSFVRPRQPRELVRALEVACAAGSRARGAASEGYAVVQDWLPEADDGEKRLLWLDGTVVGGYLRHRAPGELRHNLKMGGQPHPTDLEPDDVTLAARLTPHLQSAGIWLAGIDVIGGRAVEVNTLNPGGAHYSGHFSGRDLGAELVTTLERRVLARAEQPVGPSRP